jgi:ribosome-associated protein
MIEIAPGIVLDESLIVWELLHASGPGGQNVNKVATAVRLRISITNLHFPSEVQERLIHLAGQRITTNNELIIEAHRFRTQEANRQDALQRLINLLFKASQSPRKRRPTRPSRASVKRRLEEKRLHSQLKQVRRHPSDSVD